MKDCIPRVGILSTHPIQYYAPWYRALAATDKIDLMVYYCQNLTPEEHAKAGYGVPFSWDVPLLDGYSHCFLKNRSRRPNVSSYFGCDTPEIEQPIRDGRHDAFIIQGWNTRSYVQAIRACWKYGVPVLVRGDSHMSTPRSWWKRIAKFPLYRWFIPRFQGYLIVGKRAREYYASYGASERSMYVTPHCVDNDYFARAVGALTPERPQIRRELGIPENSIVFLFVGRLISLKRPFDMLTALQRIKGRLPNVRGLIVGEGPLRKKLEAFSLQHKIPVKFAGFVNQSQLPRVFVASDVLVLPSSQETWGLVVNEAMASGLPVMASDVVGCAPDLIRSGVTGDTFTCGNVDELSNLMVRCVSTPDKIREMSAAAREHIRAFSLANAVEGTLRAVYSVIKLSPLTNEESSKPKGRSEIRQ